MQEQGPDKKYQPGLELLNQLDQALTHGPWNSSGLLGGIGAILQEFRNHLGQMLDQNAVKAHQTEAIGTVNGASVYISLYQSQGTNIQRWRTVIASLSTYGISRPIYRQEANLKNALFSNTQPSNYAYVEMKIQPEDILSTQPKDIRTDRTGCELLTLRENALKLENIVRFVHVTGEYQWINGFLVKQKALSPFKNEG